MKTDQKQKKSLKLMIVLSSILTSLLFFTVLIFGSKSYIFDNQTKDRDSHINSIGNMFITMLERPHSEGQLAEVERMIQTKHLPEFISYIEVFKGNEQVAERKGSNNGKCSLLKDHKYNFLNEIDNKPMGHIIIRESLCSLKKRQNDLQNLALLIFITFIIISFLITVYTTNLVFKPLHRVVKESSNSEHFSDKIITAAPSEIKPLIIKLFESINYKARAELQKEIVHNVHSKLTTLGIILKKRAKDFDDEALSYFKEVENSINSLRRPTEELKDFLGDVEEIHLNDLINKVCKEKQKEYRLKDFEINISNITLENWTLYTHFNLNFLKVTLENIINNAADAINRNGNIKVALSGGREGHTIKVIDDGSGLKEDLWEDIFKKGFTLKEKGTGSGLYQASRIKELGGDIFVEHSEVGVGTSISIVIPAYHPEKETSEPSIDPNTQILLLDDDVNLLKRLKKELSALGIHSTVFTNSIDFLRDIDLYPKDLPIVFDLQLMPEGKTGDEIARKVKEKGFHNLTLYSGEEYNDIKDRIMVPFRGFIPKKAGTIINDLVKLINNLDKEL